MIRVDSLTRHWGSFALQNVNLEVPGGEYFVILGPCGSGKTLLLESIAGLYSIPRNRGRILVNQRDVTQLVPEKRRVGLVYQRYALFPHLSVRSNIGFGLRYLKLSKADRERRIDEMIDLLEIQDLAERQNPSSLSGGESQKVALARALAIRPEALLLDEPLSSLDQCAREKVIELLPRLNEELHIPVIHVTHHYSEALALADRVGVMRNGKMVQTGKVDDVFRRPETEFVAEFLGMANIKPCQVTKDKVTLGDISLFVGEARHPEGAASLCIRPEDLLIHAMEPAVMANVVPGRISSLRDLGFAVTVTLQVGGLEFEATLSERDVAIGGFTIGSQVSLEFPPEKLHLMKPEACSDAS